MEKLGAVQQKISCVFETMVLDEPSTKRENQSYRVVAGNTIKQRAVDNDIHTALPTEKLDGTCVYISNFEGNPWLWARFDRKPTKAAEKRFRKLQQQKLRQGGGEEGSGNHSPFKWDMTKDFKEPPDHWVPALGVQCVDGSPVPDDIGHTPGWVPISPTARQYCWHLSAVDLEAGLAVVLCEENAGEGLYIDCVPLSQLLGHTAELIGTNINGNPYGIGSKKSPIHLLVVHGSIKTHPPSPPIIQNDTVKEWFQGPGQMEGIVWHCANGTMFKVHRNHVALAWPVKKPALTLRPVTISMASLPNDLDTDNDLICQLRKIKGHVCSSVRDLERLTTAVNNDDCFEKEVGDKSGIVIGNNVEIVAVSS